MLSGLDSTRPTTQILATFSVPSEVPILECVYIYTYRAIHYVICVRLDPTYDTDFSNL